MTLKFVMDSVDGLVTDIANLYTKGDDGKFTLTGIEGVTSRDKVTEFRDNNIRLTETLKKFDGIDPEKVKTMETELAEAKIQIEKNSGKLDEAAVNAIVEGRVKEINKKAADEKAGLENTISVQAKQLETLIIDNNISKYAVEHKVLDTAVTDVMLRAKSVFKVVEGKPTAFDADGNKMYGPDGVSELSIGDWVKSLVRTSPHLFEPSVSGRMRNQGGSFKGDASKLSPLAKIQAGLS